MKGEGEVGGVPALMLRVRRLWPQKVRTRLTLIYAALFFIAGLALLALTYGLVASSLPARPPAATRILSSQQLNFLNRDCKPPTRAEKGNPPSPWLQVAYSRVQAAGGGL
jgi:hypothetical protein